MESREEAAPLLARSRSASPTARTAPTDEGGLSTSVGSAFYPYALVYIFALSFVADVGGSLVDTPEVRLLEMAVCRDYYRKHDPTVIGQPPLSYVDEKLCKVNEIQGDLAYIRAAKSLLMTLPGMLLTFPYGRLADRIGRKPVAFLGMLGQVLAYFWVILVCYFHQVFPTWLVLVSPIFLAIGGGSRVLSAIMSTIIVDTAPEHMRTTIFYVIGAGLLVTDTVAAPVGSWLLSKDLWLPFKFSAPILLMSFPLILAMPETLPPRKEASSSNGQASDRAASGQPSKSSQLLSSVRRWFSEWKQTLRRLNPLSVRREITLCLAIMYLSAFSRMSGGLFIQYASKLLGWSISTAGYIIAVKSLVTLCTLLSLACIVQILERKHGQRPLSLDVWVIRLSLAALTAGAVFVGASREAVLLIAGSVLTSAGNGIMQALQGFLASFADKSSTGELFAGAALVELLAQFTGSFAFAKLFNVGLHMTPSWGIGIPFFASGVLNLIAGMLSLLLPTTRGNP